MDQQDLIALLADGGFHSGHSLATRLKVTRTIVQQYIEQLRAMGIEIHSVTGKGYRLPTVFIPLSQHRILESMGAVSGIWKRHLEVCFSTGSTNADVMRLAQKGERRHLLIAEYQESGRGRRGKEWISPLGASIAMSVLWTFDAGMETLEGLSLAVAVLVIDALHACSYSNGLGVKWPNDILLEGRKLAGILIEIAGNPGGPCSVVIGIGVNVKMPYSMDERINQSYTDLSRHFEQNPDRNKIVAALASSLTAGLTQFAKEGFAPFQQAWEQLDVYKGRRVDIISGKNKMTGVSAGVDGSGALLLDTAEGRRVIAGGELSPSLRPVSE